MSFCAYLRGTNNIFSLTAKCSTSFCFVLYILSYDIYVCISFSQWSLKIVQEKASLTDMLTAKINVM